jgi:hypothetical protein
LRKEIEVFERPLALVTEVIESKETTKCAICEWPQLVTVGLLLSVRRRDGGPAETRGRSDQRVDQRAGRVDHHSLGKREDLVHLVAILR